MILQERDRRILQLCYEQGFLTVEHLHRGFFPGAGMGAAYRRVRELEAGGLLRRSRVSVLSGQQVILPTPTGVEIARGLSACEVPVRKKPLLHTLDHDALVTSVRLRLQEIYGVATSTWVPEGHLKRKGGEQVPDGVLYLGPTQQIYVEVENSIKGGKRLVSILDQYRRNSARIPVLYVAASSTIERVLTRVFWEYKESTQFSLITWERLNSDDPVIWSPRATTNLKTGKTQENQNELRNNQ